MDPVVESFCYWLFLFSNCPFAFFEIKQGLVNLFCKVLAKRQYLTSKLYGGDLGPYNPIWCRRGTLFANVKRLDQWTLRISSLYIKVPVCTYLCTYVPFSRPNRQTNLHQILHRPPHQLREGSKHKQDCTNPAPGPQGTPNSKTQMGHGRENFV